MLTHGLKTTVFNPWVGYGLACCYCSRLLLPRVLMDRADMTILRWLTCADMLLKAAANLRLRRDPRWIKLLQLAKLALEMAALRRRRRRTSLPRVDLRLVTSAEFEARCRFTREQFERLDQYLRLPDFVEGGHNFPGSKCLFMLLNRLSYPCRNWQVAELVGISQDYASRLLTFTARQMLLKWGYLIEFTQGKFPPDVIARYIWHAA
jgi:hypothetical protein